MMINFAPIRRLYQSGQHEEARRRLIELAEQYPNDAAVHYEAACVHDTLGHERAAIPFYLAAIRNGLDGPDLRSAYLGLGSSYRTLGMYAESQQVLQEGLIRFPDAPELRVFLAMTLYNLAMYHDSVSMLLTVIADTSADPETQAYARAIRLYAENLDRFSEV